MVQVDEPARNYRYPQPARGCASPPGVIASRPVPATLGELWRSVSAHHGGGS